MMTARGRTGAIITAMTEPPRIAGFLLTEHAEWQMRRRGLSQPLVRAVLTTPEQRIGVRPGREVWQSRHSLGPPEKQYLIRVVLDLDRLPPEIVTAYITSRVDKYWKRLG